MRFKSIKKAIEHLQCEGYEPTDLQNFCGYTCQTWEDVEEQIKDRDVHTFTGEWFYFGIEKKA